MSRLKISCNSKIQILYTLTYILKNSSFINIFNITDSELNVQKVFYKSLNASSQTHAILVNIWNNLSLKYCFLTIYNRKVHTGKYYCPKAF